MPDPTATEVATYSAIGLGSGGGFLFLLYRASNFLYEKKYQPRWAAELDAARRESDARIKRDQDMPAAIQKLTESVEALTKMTAAVAQLVTGTSEQAARNGAMQKIALETDRKIAGGFKALLDVQKQIATVLIRVDDRSRLPAEGQTREDIAGAINFLRGTVADLGEDASNFDVPPLSDQDAASPVPPSQNPKPGSSARLRTPGVAKPPG